MISDEVLIRTILIGILAGGVAVGAQRLMFRKSIAFFVAAIVVIPIVVGCAVGLVLGARGVNHFVWGAPVVIIVTTACIEVIAWRLRNPLNEMIKTMDSLSQGNVHAEFDKKYLKGGHELARVMRRVEKLIESLKNITVFANHVGKGELNVEYTLLGDNDAMGAAMLDMRANLLKAEAEKEARQLEDERRNWITHGIATFAELLRVNHSTIEELCHSILKNLVKYIEANQAGIFILNDEDEQNKSLELVACYAYERRKFLQKTIGVGEGLVGTCFLEGQSIYMSDIPKDYVRITSGLGSDTPRTLLITPLRVNENVYGVLEIATFKEFEPHVREFIEKVAESIASTIASVNVNMRTNKLLEQSKIQAEAMLNQEEELRQNMEEMQATQEEMRRHETELQKTLQQMKESQSVSEDKAYEMDQFHEAVFNSCNIIMLSIDGIITDVNEHLLSIYPGVNKMEFIGKHMTEFISPDCYQSAWKNLKDGKVYEETQAIDSGKGIQNIHHKFIPICNRSGNLMWILIILYRR